MWTKAHASHARGPLILTTRESRLAKPRPITANVASVGVMERLRRRVSILSVSNYLADITALLESDLRDAGQRFAVLIERGRIADYEDLRMNRHTAIAVDTHASSPVGRYVQPLGSGRRHNAGCPDTVRQGIRSSPITTVPSSIA
jgi:hypothetical protein